MRYVKNLVPAIREMSNNQEFSQDASGATLEGIPDSLILEFLNDAQDFLQGAIVAEYPQEFTADYVFTVVSGQDSYTLPENMFINNKIISVEYSLDGNPKNYDNIYPRTVIERINVQDTHSSYYIRTGGTILLQPIPMNNQATVRIKFYRELDDLDFRRGTVVSSVAVSTNLQTITLASDAVLDAINLVSAEYVSINDAHGAPLMYKIPVSSWDSGNRIITAEANFNFDSGETIPAGSFVTNGKYSTTHSKLAKTCERFLKIYAQQRMMHKDQSGAATQESGEVQGILANILALYADPTEDVLTMPIIDYDIMV